MAHLISVTNINTNQPIVLGVGQIVHAWMVQTTGKGSHVNVKMANGDIFAIAEDLDDLVAMAEH